ncbi:MAG: LysM peptidoglycan-binding domain-containing protein [Thermogutta sp.]
METLKTIGVLAVLLVVGYLGYKAVTSPPVTPPHERTDAESHSLTDATNVSIPIPELPPGVEQQVGRQSPKASSVAGDTSFANTNIAQAGQVPTASLSAIASSALPAVAGQSSGGGEVSPSMPAAQTTPALNVIPPQPVVGAAFPESVSEDRDVTPRGFAVGAAAGKAIATPDPSAAAGKTSGLNQMENDTRTQADPAVRKEFAAFLEVACQKLDRGEFAQVHQVLSAWYADPRLTREEDAQLTDLLDQVAGTVVYSRQHILEPPYTVQPGDTLFQIAQKYDVPWELLAKINGILQPDQLPPGMQLKVIRGPFEAVIRLQRRELVLMVQGRYAGRFQIGIGKDAQRCEGVYQVREKTLNPRYYSDQGVLEANDPRNPLGPKWLGLEGRLGIHAARDPAAFHDSQSPGAIFLTTKDMDDVFDILSVGSRVVITP